MPETHWNLVTGGGTGIGRALVLEFARAGEPVLAVGRRLDPLESTREAAGTAYPGAPVQTLAADVALPEGRESIARAIGNDRVQWLVHNAGILAPVTPLRSVNLADWRTNMATNVEGPLFLTQRLLPLMAENARVLHISSGAAHRSIPGWGAYCAAKAALFRIYEVLRDECASEGRRLTVGSLRPSVVDTPMQSLIREQDASSFPAVEQFRAMKEQGQLHDPDDVARFAHWVLRHTDNDAFAAEEWDLGNADHTAQWRAATP